MKTINFFILFALLLSTSISRAQTSQEVFEFKQRKSLPNFLHKASGGSEIKVAYFGGSITAQAGWRVQSLAWLNKRFPASSFEEINAAIGGTASDFGVFRLNEHVLKFNPDLIFVEFAVNDGGLSTEVTMRAMEGIVRQIWEYNPNIDICFVYTIHGRYLEVEKDGVLPKAAIAMEQIADKYGIPTVNFGREVCRQIAAGKLILKGSATEENGVAVFSPDEVHPYPETGHVIYQQVLAKAIDEMAEQKMKPRKHKLSRPISDDYFAHTNLIDFEKADLKGNWKIVETDGHPLFEKFNKYLQTIGVGSETGSKLSLRFKGTAIGIYDIMGPNAGEVTVQIDDQEPKTLRRFDAYCTYYRMNKILFDQLEDKEHTVTFTVNSDPFDKAEILAGRNNVIDDQAKYAENNWYVGKILLSGELLD